MSCKEDEQKFKGTILAVNANNSVSLKKSASGNI